MAKDLNVKIGVVKNLEEKIKRLEEKKKEAIERAKKNEKEINELKQCQRKILSQDFPWSKDDEKKVDDFIESIEGIRDIEKIDLIIFKIAILVRKQDLKSKYNECVEPEISQRVGVKTAEITRRLTKIYKALNKDELFRKKHNTLKNFEKEKFCGSDNMLKRISEYLFY